MQPFKLGKKKLKNKIVFLPLSLNWAENDGCLSNRWYSFYERIAQGGCGMVVISGTAVSPEGKGSSHSLGLWDNKHVSVLKRLTNMLNLHNCYSSIQLMHVGGQGNPKFIHTEPVAPSRYFCKATGFQARELSVLEIKSIQNDFVDAACRAHKAGFCAVELHLAHGYLLHQFISPYFNKRTDQYSVNRKHGLQLIDDIISEIKVRVPEVTIGVRLSGEDFVDGGINVQANNFIVPLLESLGVGYISVTAGIYDSGTEKHKAMQTGMFFQYAKDIKKMTSAPVIGAGKVFSLQQADNYLCDETCDLVGIGRAMVADPALVRKSLNGGSFNKCTECGNCQYLRFGKSEVNCPLYEETFACSDQY